MRKADPFEALIIEKYRFWTLYLEKDQCYLGRAYAWLRRPGKMQRFSQLNPRERDELDRIIFRYEHAVDALWKPDHWNNAWLGNLVKIHGGHGHMHLIPRYRTRRLFAGIQFTDGRFEQGEEKNVWPYEKYFPSEETLLTIRDTIRTQLKK